jgi:signal transduction histidine kinase
MTDQPTGSTQPSRGLSRGELGLVALLVALLILTLLTALLPQLRFAALAPDFDLLINGVSALVAGTAAWLSWLRYRHINDVSAVFQAAAFMVFSLAATVQTMAHLGVGDVELGLSLANPGQAPIYTWSFVRVLAGALLLSSAWLRLHPPATYRWGWTPIGLTLAAVVAGSVTLYLLEPVLPPLLGAEALARLEAPGDLEGPLPGITLLELVLQSIGVVLLGAAAFTYAVAARRGRAPAGMYLAAGLLIASTAQVHFALFPGVYTGLVTSSDLLRIFFYVFVLVGIQAEAGAVLRDLRGANRRLSEMRELEVTNASLAERARLAREVHDGLAQHLWLAKLAIERLEPGATAADISATRAELGGLLEAGLDEARQTVSALRDAASSTGPLADALARHVRRFEDRTGLTARLSLDARLDVPPRASAEVLRIAQEALNNVRKHADATVVDVELAQAGDMLRISIRDNGVGFDPATDHSGFGLESMRERAEAVGGRIEIESSAMAGTTVRVTVPLGQGRAL